MNVNDAAMIIRHHGARIAGLDSVTELEYADELLADAKQSIKGALSCGLISVTEYGKLIKGVAVYPLTPSRHP